MTIMKVVREGGRGSLARFRNLKIVSQFTDKKNSFYRITKIRKYDILLNDLFLH